MDRAPRRWHAVGQRRQGTVEHGAGVGAVTRPSAATAANRIATVTDEVVRGQAAEAGSGVVQSKYYNRLQADGEESMPSQKQPRRREITERALFSSPGCSAAYEKKTPSSSLMRARSRRLILPSLSFPIPCSASPSPSPNRSCSSRQIDSSRAKSIPRVPNPRI